jgi:hypothetical protein
VTKASGIKRCTRYADKYDKSKVEMLSRVQQLLTVNPSKPALFAGKIWASTWEKIWGRKRNVLVDTQGNLLAVKVNTASGSNLQGAKSMLEPVKDLFPRLKLL